MEKITLSRKIEIMQKVLKMLHNFNGEHYMCNCIYAAYKRFPSVKKMKTTEECENEKWNDERETLLNTHFPEFFKYSPLDERYSPWWTNGFIDERVKIVKDLIYRYDKAMKQKKSVNAIKGKYVPPKNYSYFGEY